MKKGIIFYTDNETEENIANVVIENILAIAKEKELPIVTAALKRQLDFGETNLFFPELKRSPLSQFREILACLEVSTADVIFFCEADILYHPSHFNFVPTSHEQYYYNTNVWKVWLDEKVATRTDNSMQLSGFCGFRDLLVGHYRRRVTKILQNQIDLVNQGFGADIKNEGYSKHMGYEPGGHMDPRGVDHYPQVAWNALCPNLDLRHSNNLTKAKRHPSDYKDQKWAKGWVESRDIPYWGNVDNIVEKFV